MSVLSVTNIRYVMKSNVSTSDESFPGATNQLIQSFSEHKVFLLLLGLKWPGLSLKKSAYVHLVRHKLPDLAITM